MIDNVKIFVVLRYINYFLGFIKGLVFAIVFTPAEFGYWTYLLLILTIVGYTNFGSEQYLAISYTRSSNFNNKINKINLYTLFHFFIGFVFLACSYIFIDYDIYPFHQFILITLIYFFQIFQKNYSSILRVDGKINIIGFSEIMVSSLTIIPALLVFFNFIKLPFVKIIDFTLFIWLIGLLLKQFLYIVYSKNKLYKFNLNFDKYKYIYGIGIPLLISNTVFYFIIHSNKLLIKEFLNFEELGYFNFAFSISYTIMMFFGSIIWAIFPKLMETFKNIQDDTITKIQKIEEYQRIYSFLILLTGICLLSAIKPLIINFLPKYINSINLITTLIFAQYFISNSVFYKTCLFANYEKKKILISTLIGFILGFIISVVFLLISDNIQFISYSICVSYIIISISYIYSYSLITKKLNLLIILHKTFLPNFSIHIVLFLILYFYLPNFLFLIPFALVLTNIELLKKSIKILHYD